MSWSVGLSGCINPGDTLSMSLNFLAARLAYMKVIAHLIQSYIDAGEPITLDAAYIKLKSAGVLHALTSLSTLDYI
jgi:hypothetical protein